MARSIRVLYRGAHGRQRKNFNFSPINQQSAVIITAAEFALAGDPSAGIVGRPHLGEANVYVTNIGPHNPEPGVGGVEFHLHVESGSPVDVMVTITVLENVEQFVAA